MTDPAQSSSSAPETLAPSADAFIARWRPSGGAERANYGLFISELCDLIGVSRPDPATEDDRQNAYTFDRLVTHTRPDGTTTSNYIDCYKRGHFIFETKQGIEKRARDAGEFRPAAAPKLKTGHGTRGSARWDAAMLAARNQAERYARALPTAEGWPPFLIIADIGHTIELYSEFSRTGKTYVPYPDPQTFRIPLADLAKPEIRERLRLLFTDPLALDPTRHSAKVTREVAQHLAQLSKSLEADGHEPERTANFLMRCIFTMFAEDVHLIPPDSFRDLLKLFTIHTAAHQRLAPALFPGMVHDVWRAMDEGGVSSSLRAKLQRFNGGLFAQTEVLPLSEGQITLLYTAATCQWREVEPAIFGTLLERALNAKERHKLGAHYTPRAYVERLVLPTVIDPLREDWQNSLTAAVMLDGQGKWREAVQTCRDFLYQLTQTIVLDPACGTGNFLYVTLEHMKRLEGEVRDAIANFTGSHQAEIEATEFQVDPHQFLGIEINPRAAAIAELVLWIGYLQWQIKALGTSTLPEPVLRNYHNIENRDAVLQYDRTELLLDKDGNTVTRWDGDTTKTHPVTGEKVPDETARTAVLKYINPTKTEWPNADFIVGNPPFLGDKRMRLVLGEGYAEALRATYTEVPASCDLVMYFWERAAALVRAGDVNSFGFITTNSITQYFNSRVLHRNLTAEPPLRLTFCIPDHPWVESSDGAAVRIAITVAAKGAGHGTLLTINSESKTEPVSYNSKVGQITHTLTVGTEIGGLAELRANAALCSVGMALHAQGLALSDTDARDLLKLSLEYGIDNPVRFIKPTINGRDLTGAPRDKYVIDLYGVDENELKTLGPIYQWVLARVYPERSRNLRASYRNKWWIFGEARKELRNALSGLQRFIATPMTAKHRTFVFLDSTILPDQGLICFGIEDALILGTLSSKAHSLWALKAGGLLGPTPRYNNSVCFDPFPFPTPTPAQTARIRDLGERLDAHRKRQQALHPKLTLTDCYNVLEKLRAGQSLTPKDRVIHDQGLVTVLLQLHTELDAAVAEAYGWPADLADEEILTRLVDLNHERAAEEAQGKIRYLRPEYQDPAIKPKPEERKAIQQNLLPEEAPAGAPKAGKATKSTKGGKEAKAKNPRKQPWPKTLPEQAKAVHAVLREMEDATPEKVAELFKGAKVQQVQAIIETLVALGQIQDQLAGPKLL